MNTCSMPIVAAMRDFSHAGSYDRTVTVPADAAPPTPRDTVSRNDGPTAGWDAIGMLALLATIALTTVATGWVLWSSPDGAGDFNRRVSMQPFDWPLAVLIGVRVLAHVRARPALPGSWAGRIALATLGWFAVATVANPSWRAADLAFHTAGAYAVFDQVRAADATQRRMFLGALTLLASTQATLGIAQSLAGSTVGLGVLEFVGPLYSFGSNHAGRGSLTHPYHLTALLVVGATAAVLFVRGAASRTSALNGLLALGVVGVAIPLTFSRAVVLGLVPMLLLLAAKSTRRSALALAAGLVVGAAIGVSGLSAEAADSVDVDEVDSGRRIRFEHAVELVRDDPLFGVGPGRYTIALDEKIAGAELLPPHNIVAQAAAEAGVPGALFVMGAGSTALAAVARRKDRVLAATVVSLLPFHLLDSYPHAFPTGILISGLWLSCAHVALAARESPQ